jgi:hypothetical protein
LAVGDGAVGFWKALAEVFPETRAQRCWVHKTANVLDSMVKSAQPVAKRAVQDIYNAEDKDQARKAVAAFARQYGAKYPKAVKKITDDEDELLAFIDFPAEHWIHLRTTNPIESTFATPAVLYVDELEVLIDESIEILHDCAAEAGVTYRFASRRWRRTTTKTKTFRTCSTLPPAVFAGCP